MMQEEEETGKLQTFHVFSFLIFHHSHSVFVQSHTLSHCSNYVFSLSISLSPSVFQLRCEELYIQLLPSPAVHPKSLLK